MEGVLTCPTGPSLGLLDCLPHLVAACSVMNRKDLPSTCKDSSTVVATVSGRGTTCKDSSTVVATISGRGTHVCPREGAGELANHVSTPEQGLPEVTACKQGLFSLLLTLLLRQVCIHCRPWHRL